MPAKSKAPLSRWTKRLKSLRALSLRQPWAWLVVNGYKDIENRSWRTNHRGPLLIHASSNLTEFSETAAMVETKYHIPVPENVEAGGIVGVVDVADCVKTHDSKWKFRNRWGWVLENPRRLPYRQCKGFVGLFKPKLK
jgi:hypothetical protein